MAESSSNFFNVLKSCAEALALRVAMQLRDVELRLHGSPQGQVICCEDVPGNVRATGLSYHLSWTNEVVECSPQGASALGSAACRVYCIFHGEAGAGCDNRRRCCKKSELRARTLAQMQRCKRRPSHRPRSYGRTSCLRH
eukprot:775339-Pleurochrysis_carterae.AAC.2